MKNTFYAAAAACLAMLITSGVIALATAASKGDSSSEMRNRDYLDSRIHAQLQQAKIRISLHVAH